MHGKAGKFTKEYKATTRYTTLGRIGNRKISLAKKWRASVATGVAGER